MSKSINESIFEAMLSSAFTEYLDELLAKTPSDDELSKRFPLPKKEAKWINRRIKEKRHNRHRSLAVIYAQRVAIIFLVFVSLSFALLSTSSKVQAAIKDTVVEWYEKYILFKFTSSDDTNNDVRLPDSYNIEYIPDTFKQTESIQRVDFRQYVYTDNKDNYLVIEISSIDVSEIMVDIEYNGYDEIPLRGEKAYLLYNDENQSGILTWSDGNNTIMVDGILSKEELIKIAENIK